MRWATHYICGYYQLTGGVVIVQDLHSAMTFVGKPMLLHQRLAVRIMAAADQITIKRLDPQSHCLQAGAAWDADDLLHVERPQPNNFYGTAS